MTSAFLLVAVLLLSGVVLRRRIGLFRRLFIPGSVIAGFVGLAAVSITWRFGNEPLRARTSDLLETLAGWPGPLIAVVFAAMMLQKPVGTGPRPRDESAAARVGRQGLMVWIIVLGETMVGLIATGVLIQPFYDVPNSFGMLIETGFAGGHGTAAAMGQVFSSEQVGFDAGLDLGLLMATCGLVYGLVSGIVWINLAARKGWTVKRDHDAAAAADGEAEPSPIGFQRMSPSVIDPLLLQIVWVALAVGAGLLMQAVVMQAAGAIDGMIQSGPVAEGADAELAKRMTASRVMDFPLFIYTMFGGWLVRRGLVFWHRADWVDSPTVQRLSATAMEVLVVAAITSLKLSAVAALIVPFSVLFVVGAAWAAFCLLWISRRVLPRDHWFELGLINYGMSTGTTATGFILLRVVDPDLKTTAASEYALAAPLSAPFIGGGILTIALPMIVMERVSILWPIAVITVIVVTLVLIGRSLGRRQHFNLG